MKRTFGCLIAAALVLGPAGLRAAAQTADEDAAILRDFSSRVEAYDALRAGIRVRAPFAEPSADPQQIQQRVDALGDALRAARRDARPGDIFTPAVTTVFRRLIRSSCDGHFQELLEATQEDMEFTQPPVVNGHWPGEGFTCMPPLLLCSLPPLPDGLEYRFVQRDLVLWDSHADLIVDVMTGAIPPLT
ncbi:MAG TPA: hypothetical protein VD833_06465 [Vicinamibacterales bacterium]|nr:hypothetical protein [Vicinamibacterales bacterium]